MDKRFYSTPHGSRKFLRGLTATSLYDPIAYFKREIEKLEKKIAVETDPNRLGAFGHWLEVLQSNHDAVQSAQQMIYEENEAINETIEGPTLVTVNTTAGDQT